jgi:hypothetical protein
MKYQVIFEHNNGSKNIINKELPDSLTGTFNGSDADELNYTLKIKVDKIELTIKPGIIRNQIPALITSFVTNAYRLKKLEAI